MESEEVSLLLLLLKSIESNSHMSRVIIDEKIRLRDYAIFLATLDVSKLPSRNFLNNWLHSM